METGTHQTVRSVVKLIIGLALQGNQALMGATFALSGITELCGPILNYKTHLTFGAALAVAAVGFAACGFSAYLMVLHVRVFRFHRSVRLLGDIDENARSLRAEGSGSRTESAAMLKLERRLTSAAILACRYGALPASGCWPRWAGTLAIDR
jgi:hypothetical protein